ncbi:MAG TPA: alpha/beta hydrolase-fold protein [Opitutaceae bacterium]
MRSFARLLCLLVLPALAVAAAEPACAGAPVAIPRSAMRTLTASGSGLVYRVFVAWPDGPAPAAGFPVVYVLDGNAWFASVVETVRVLSGNMQGTGVVPAIVVSVGYPTDKPHDSARRTRDYTPATGGGETPAGSGGADAFLAFLEQELKPAIARDWPVDPTRQTLIGHSFGGLFVVHALLTRPEAFQNYVAVSPSIWWNGCAVLANEAGLADRLMRAPGVRRVFLAAGEFEQAADPARTRSAERLATLLERRMVDNARELIERLAALPGRPLEAQFAYFPQENHGSVVPGAISRALPFVLGPAR